MMGYEPKCGGKICKVASSTCRGNMSPNRVTAMSEQRHGGRVPVGIQCCSTLMIHHHSCERECKEWLHMLKSNAPLRGAAPIVEWLYMIQPSVIPTFPGILPFVVSGNQAAVETIYFLENAAAPAMTPIRQSVESGTPVDVIIDTLVYYLRRVNRVRFAFTLFFPYRLTTWLTSMLHFNP
jgi:hypothetical protein